MRHRPPLALLLLAVSCCGLAVFADSPETDPEAVVQEALRAAGSIEQQAAALARLAWPADARDEALAQEALRLLRNYGRHAIPVLHRSFSEVRPDYQHETVEVLIAAFNRNTTINPNEYLVALDEALWFGNRRSRELAIPELSRYSNQVFLLPMIDAALEDPELMPVTLRAIARMRDERARFFLNDVLHGESGELRDEAARILGQIGGLAGAPLRDALHSERREIRLAAVRGLLPHATVDDLTVLYEYYGNHADDDPETMEQVRQTALELEQRLQAKRDAESASPSPDR